MNKKESIVWSCLALWIGTTNTVEAESLWQHRTPQRGFLFYDSKARNVGDNVTVLISQITDVNNKEDRKMNKQTSLKSAFDLEGSSDGGFGTQGAKAALDINSSSARKFSGDATYSSAQAFTDQMTATVMDVLPNGNMVISGERRVRVEGEEKTLVLSGIIRGLDLGPDNMIKSQYISQFRLDYQGGNTSQKFTRQGWLGRALNVVWPY